MKSALHIDEWALREEGFSPELQEFAESIFSLGNGHMGQRANFEEDYSGTSLQGSYFAGIYYPDKTRVSWWKNGYPEYYAKVVNSVNWIGIRVLIDGELLDLAKCSILEFHRTLDFQSGLLTRDFSATIASGKTLHVRAERFLSLKRPQIGTIRYAVTPMNFSGLIQLLPYLDGNVTNRDSNHGETFWEAAVTELPSNRPTLTMKIKKLDFHICSVMNTTLELDGAHLAVTPETQAQPGFVATSYGTQVQQGHTLTLYKYVANVTSRDHAVADIAKEADTQVAAASALGYKALLFEQEQAWSEKWHIHDIVIAGDPAVQQGIRFNIFQLLQTYTGVDARLNIGPKGFTGEKYGGSTYWDTEAFCLPFYLGTAGQQVARNLLLYRYRQLDKARANARNLGIKRGALFPMVTMNGEECHNEWEITFEEIHRNGAIAYAIYHYVQHSGDEPYLIDFGFEVLAEISRFWAERVSFSSAKQQYVLLGVTGPNEYENNVNNNWYTNRIASWTLEYTLEVRALLQTVAPDRYQQWLAQLQLTEAEFDRWRDIVANMYYPLDQERGIFLQQDGFLDKEVRLVAELDSKDLPLHRHWSWDRILRSCFIKQADVLQGMYFFGEHYDPETKRRHFHFYEPLTVHESSLSPSVHSILACEIGEHAKAYELLLRSARLDLDNLNQDTEDGCHITSMAGTWLAIVHGFGGVRSKNGRLHLHPQLPHEWSGYSFHLWFMGARLFIQVTKAKVTVTNVSDIAVPFTIFGHPYELTAGGEQSVQVPTTTA